MIASHHPVCGWLHCATVPTFALEAVAVPSHLDNEGTLAGGLLANVRLPPPKPDPPQPDPQQGGRGPRGPRGPRVRGAGSGRGGGGGDGGDGSGHGGGAGLTKEVKERAKLLQTKAARRLPPIIQKVRTMLESDERGGPPTPREEAHVCTWRPNPSRATEPSLY